jgi:hypothetical protein
MKSGGGVMYLALGLSYVALAGCAVPETARYVYQDGQFGVVAIPVNTWLAGIDYRSQAEELMWRHFPEGYQIVRAEEVNEGERILDLGKKTELETDPTVRAWDQVIKLGKLNRSTSFEEKDKLQVRECRIIYKRKSPKERGSQGEFSAVASLSPPFYLDPNELMRREIRTEMLAKASSNAKRTGDQSVQKASNETASTQKSGASPSLAKLSPGADW